ncbi:MAG: cytochrome P450 [Pseudonocardiaceae bacterium]|nr:cytochrome P450 [Pseudonocardiaceae bacterium]
MTNPADRWGIHPDHFWLHGQQPEQPVRFDEETGAWNVYGYPEAQHVLADPETFASDTSRFFPPEASMYSEGDLTMMDGADHRKLRKLVTHSFTPKTVADLEPRIRQVATELLDAVEGERFEMVTALAYPFPVIVIAELLGVPVSDRDRFREMVNQILQIGAQAADMSQVQPEEGTGNGQATQKFADYMNEQAAERRKRPREDLLTQLVEAEVDGDRLTDAQVANFAGLLLAAGFITTTMLLGNTMLCLDRYPRHFAEMRDDRAKVPAVIEEALRFLSPIAMTARATNVNAELGDCRIPRDKFVQVWFSAANRDPRQFERPDEFNPSRESSAHLAFGRGVHFCLGAGLARLEARVAMNLLLDRFDGLRVDPDNPPTFLPLPAFTGPETLTLLTK